MLLELSYLMSHFFRHILLSGNRRLISLGLASLGLLTSPAYAKYTDIFTQHQIDLKFNVNQPVLIADLLPQAGEELVIVGVDDNQQRMLAIYFFDTQTNTYIQQDKTILQTMFLPMMWVKHNKMVYSVCTS
jgi:hypothetical protein